MQKMGVKKFSVVHSHWHLEHIAGDAVYDDSDVITTTAKAAFICSSLIEKYTSKI